MKTKPFIKSDSFAVSLGLYVPRKWFFLWMIFILSIPKIHAQKKCLVSCYSAGDCKNFMFFDRQFDSTFASHNINHKFKLIGIGFDELDKYSKLIFGRKIDSSVVLSESEIEDLNLENLQPGFLTLICNDARVTTFGIDELEDKVDFVINYACKTSLSFTPNGKKAMSDSVSFKYKRKVPLNDFRNGNTSSYIIHDKFLYATDDLFSHTLNKIDINIGETILKREYWKDLEPSKMYKTLYGDLFGMDSMMRNDSAYNRPKERTEILSIMWDKGMIYCFGTYQIFTFSSKDGNFYNFNHDIILKYDSLLNFVGYFICHDVSYRKMYPMLAYNSFFIQDTLLSAQCIYDFNTPLKTKHIMYFKLGKNLIERYRIDSLIINDRFFGLFQSNITGKFENLGTTEDPVWTMYPLPGIYYQNENMYCNLLDDSLYNSINFPLDFPDLIIDQCVKISKNIIYISYIHNNHFYYGAMNLVKKKFTLIKQYKDIRQSELRMILSNEGKPYFIPINLKSNNNYLYELE